jgi:hypothetical protein
MNIRHLAPFVLGGLLTACASGPPPAEWQLSAQGALREAVQAYLTGNDRVANAEFTRARADIASTGKLDVLARAELVRCAAQVASLDIDTCPAYQTLAADAAPAERAYAAYLSGRWQGLEVALLPPQHRAVPTATDKALGSIEDPLAQLVAAGALWQAGQLSPAGVATAVDTASSQGWRRPLLAWLGVQLKRAEAAGQTDEVQRLNRRMDLVSGKPA